jgi:hypothetical protein
MQRNRRSARGKLYPAFFHRDPFESEHLSIKFAHRIHLASKQNYARHLH